jgi:hypothetical protein
MPAFAGQPERFLTIVRRLCDTLAFLHGEGIVHRDLKPENVFLRDDETPVMVDFGLVGRGGEAREVLDLQVLAGTPQYIAPEQLQGAVVDARADLYAVGCILYEVATGRVPFEAQTLAQLRELRGTAPTPPSSLVLGFPLSLEDFALRLLAPAPRDRVGHASDVVRALERHGARPWSVPIPEARSYVYRPALTGRDRLLWRIAVGLSSLKEGSGGLWLLRGESGIGKTYLAMTAARDAALSGVLPVMCRCQPIGSGAATPDGEATTDAPLSGLEPLLRTLADACLEHPSRASEILGPRARILAACEPALAHLPCFREAEEPAELPPLAARERLFGALADSLSALAALRPVLLVVDDLQWADELTSAFLASLPEAFLRERPVVVLATYRRDEITPEVTRVEARPDAVVLDVGRLDEAAVGAMVGDMLAQRQVPAPFAAFLAARSEGNPFFVAEYVRAAVEEGLLRRTEHGGFRVQESGKAWDGLPLPTSLAALVERRLGGLGPEARAALGAASVIGREVPLAVLARVTGLDEAPLLAIVRELTRHLVLEDAPFGELRFAHDKLREVAYESLSADARRALHGAVAEALLSVGDPGDPALAPALAHHFLSAGDAARAAPFLERAGEHALASFASREAAGFFHQLVALSDRLDHGPLRPSDVLRRVRWERMLSDAHFGMGDVNGMLEHAEAALRWAGVKPPVSSGGWLASFARNLPLQLAHRVLPERFVAEDETERAISREASAAMQRLAQRSYFLDANAMVAGSLWSVNLAERAGGAPHVALSYAMLGMVAGIARLSAPAERYFALARRTARAHGDAGGLVEADYGEATWRSGHGEWPEVYRLLHEAEERSRRLGDRNQEDIVRTVLANTDFFTGDFRSSKARLEDVARSAQRRDNKQHLAWGLYGAARAMVPLGEEGAAAALLEEAASVLVPQEELPSKIICHALLSLVRLRAGDRGGAHEAARTALSCILQNRLAAYATAAACADAAEVLAALAPERVEARRGLRDVTRALGWLSLAMPLAVPYRERVRARVALLQGAPRRAVNAYERALVAARRLGVPYEEARAHLALSRLAAGDSDAQRVHREAAAGILRRLGCPIEALEREI